MQMLRLTISFRANIILFHTSIELTVVCYTHTIVKLVIFTYKEV